MMLTSQLAKNATPFSAWPVYVINCFIMVEWGLAETVPHVSNSTVVSLGSLRASIGGCGVIQHPFTRS